jgi:uncharacterized membrane protein YgcG
MTTAAKSAEFDRTMGADEGSSVDDEARHAKRSKRRSAAHGAAKSRPRIEIDSTSIVKEEDGAVELKAAGDEERGAGEPAQHTMMAKALSYAPMAMIAIASVAFISIVAYTVYKRYFAAPAAAKQQAAHAYDTFDALDLQRPPGQPDLRPANARAQRRSFQQPQPPQPPQPQPQPQSPPPPPPPTPAAAPPRAVSDVEYAHMLTSGFIAAAARLDEQAKYRVLKDLQSAVKGMLGAPRAGERQEEAFAEEAEVTLAEAKHEAARVRKESTRRAIIVDDIREEEQPPAPDDARELGREAEAEEEGEPEDKGETEAGAAGAAGGGAAGGGAAGGGAAGGGAAGAAAAGGGAAGAAAGGGAAGGGAAGGGAAGGGAAGGGGGAARGGAAGGAARGRAPRRPPAGALVLPGS